MMNSTGWGVMSPIGLSFSPLLRMKFGASWTITKAIVSSFFP